MNFIFTNRVQLQNNFLMKNFRKSSIVLIKIFIYPQKIMRYQNLRIHVLLYTDLRPGQTCHSKVMHRKEVTHSDGSYEKKVTCALHDSYFHLMTIKHAIPKIEWAIELLYNSVKLEIR